VLINSGGFVERVDEGVKTWQLFPDQFHEPTDDHGISFYGKTLSITSRTKPVSQELHKFLYAMMHYISKNYHTTNTQLTGMNQP